MFLISPLNITSHHRHINSAHLAGPCPNSLFILQVHPPSPNTIHPENALFTPNHFTHFILETEKTLPFPRLTWLTSDFWSKCYHLPRHQNKTKTKTSRSIRPHYSKCPSEAPYRDTRHHLHSKELLLPMKKTPLHEDSLHKYKFPLLKLSQNNNRMLSNLSCPVFPI